MEIKGLVGGIQKFSTQDGPGIRTTVFLKGCPLRCQWCHNPELIAMENELMYSENRCVNCGQCALECPQKAISFSNGVFNLNRSKCISCFHCVDVCYSKGLHKAAVPMTISEVIDQVEQDAGYYKHTGGGMTISGGEFMVQYEFAAALLEAAAARGIGTALDTSGYCEQAKLISIAQKADYILYDLKSINDTVHKTVVGVSNKRILENLCALADRPDINPKIWVRMPMIHGINDTEEIIHATSKFLKEHSLKTVTLLPYHELGVVKYKNLGRKSRSFDPPTQERLEEIRILFETVGAHTSILGVH